MSNGTIHSYELGVLIVEIEDGKYQVSFNSFFEDLGRVFDSLEAAQEFVYGKLTEEPPGWGSDVFPPAQIIPFPRRDR
jgi:hypothetical protein